MKPLAPAAEQERARALARMKRVPLLLLVAMAVLFLWTLGRTEPWAPWVHAFAEAGMIGALADWFAVVALFRHPLGVPIPHTAIIPQRKDALGDAMANFVAEHFLAPAAVRGKLESINMAKLGTDWLQSPRGQARLLELSDAVIRWALDALDERRVRRFLTRVTRRQLESMDFAAVLGGALEWLVQGNRHQDLLTQALRYAIVLLSEHRETIRERVAEESPWWIPGFVDDRILRKVLDRVETRLFEMSLDPEHPLRESFNDWLVRLAAELREAPEHRRTGEHFKQQLLENDELQDYLYGLWEDLSGRLEADLDAEDSRTRLEIGNAVQRLAQELEADADMQAWINEWLVDALVVVVDQNRSQISSLISDTVRTWDGKEASRRVELALGRDLQFIRVNGTLVGGLVGVVIHGLVVWAGKG
ncbi:MAG: DUF445 domain-containing protein [Xanthomonadales bacterium]|jgi:uncharacterized membrane-anchored protein YjiN (DUF445 family)|nr:DUF445 domain-containing protein [Xanthomonadales bacterium]